MSAAVYRSLTLGDLTPDLFSQFQRRQVVSKCRRRTESGFSIVDDPFIDDWTAEDYVYLLACLRMTLGTGGVVFGAFVDGALKGFASVEYIPIGPRQEYRDLTALHVSADLRGQGIGKELFRRAADWAAAKGGEKLYLSAHSAVETQAFYDAMGCREAEVYSKFHTTQEPCDCQLEYQLPQPSAPSEH